MTRRGHEIKIHFLQYVFTTRLLARFHYVFSGFSRSRWDFSGQNEFLPTQHRLGSVSDARVLAWAVAQDRPVLTRDHEDFADLHDLVLAVGGHHPGILVVRFDNDPRHNLTERAIATAIGNLESSGGRSPTGSTS